jgi:hypothetical protein
MKNYVNEMTLIKMLKYLITCADNRGEKMENFSREKETVKNDKGKI